MNGRLFYDVARRLYEDLDKSNPDETFVRTIIGRAYYAALLVSRDIANLGTRGSGGHWRVLQHYQRMGAWAWT